jgi:hypothetical protein
MFLEELLTAIWEAYGAVIQTLIALIIADLLLGVLLAIKKGEFKFEELGRFYQTSVIPILGGYLIVALVVHFVDAEVMGGFVGTFGPALETAARILAIATLAGSLITKLRDIGIIPKGISQALRLDKLGF